MGVARAGSGDADVLLCHGLLRWSALRQLIDRYRTCERPGRQGVGSMLKYLAHRYIDTTATKIAPGHSSSTAFCLVSDFPRT